MKKALLSVAIASIFALSMNGCGIKAVEPEPVPLSAPHLGKMALEHTAITNTLNICGKEVTDFKTSLRNGFNYIAGDIVTITSPEEATSTLRLDSLDVSCLDDKFVKGSIVTFNFKFTWSFKDGSEFSQSATISGGSESSVKAALVEAIENMYDFAISAYLSKLNLGNQG